MLISAHERRRYDCQLALREMGEAGQAKLRSASVLVVGAGGLGGAALSYLVAAGVGHVGVLDDDAVEVSNLHRQVLYAEADVGRSKALCAAKRLEMLNPEIEIEAHETRLTAANVEGLVSRHDVVVSAVDNFATRYVLNDGCVLLRRTLVEGAAQELVGLALTVRGGETACYRCLFPNEAPVAEEGGCAVRGVLGPVPGVIGALQALETIKVLTGIGRPLYDRLVRFDAAELTFSEVAVSRSAACPVCAASASTAGPGGEDA